VLAAAVIAAVLAGGVAGAGVTALAGDDPGTAALPRSPGAAAAARPAGSLAEVAQRVGETPARVRQEFERGGQLAAVRSDVRKRKALDWLLERVEIVDEQGQPIDRSELEITPESDSDAPEGDDVNDETESSTE